MSNEKVVTCIEDWKRRESMAESMLPLVGKLYREQNVITSIYGRPIINRSVVQILKAHRFVRQIENAELDLDETFPIIEYLSQLQLGAARVDIGKLAVKFRQQSGGKSLSAFIDEELADIIGKQSQPSSATDVVLYGFGRIGRLLARIMVERAGTHTLHLRAIVIRSKGEDDLIKRASLLRRDSVHGSFQGTISVDTENNQIFANGNCIQVIYADAPDQIDYTSYGIDNALVIDNTGKWRDEAGLGLHLKSKGVARVLLTAPGKGEIKNIVYGVNHQQVTSDDLIVSAASCTTNAITPVLKAIQDRFGIDQGHVETVHAYTNDQNLIDNYHKGNRRGRSAPLNMVITETGAAKAVAKALPELKGRLTGNAIRVPTPNVSLAILSLALNQETSPAELNDYLRETALHSMLQKQIDYTTSPDVVSSDFVGTSAAGIIDSEATIVNGNRVNLYVWYDNEYGYSRQVNRIARQMCGVFYPTFPWED